MFYILFMLVNLRVDTLKAYTDLQYHLTFMINRLMFGLRIKNPLLDEVKTKYPLAFKMAQIAGQVIENEYDFETSEDELGFLAFYFGVFISNTNVKVKTIERQPLSVGQVEELQSY